MQGIFHKDVSKDFNLHLSCFSKFLCDAVIHHNTLKKRSHRHKYIRVGSKIRHKEINLGKFLD